jgi:hypothetical protein
MVTHILKQPTRGVLIEVDISRRIFGLAPAGVYRAARVTTSAVGSYSTISPLPSKMAVCFLWHFPSPAVRTTCAQGLPGNLSTGARTFLELCIVKILMRDRPTDCFFLKYNQTDECINGESL